MFDSQIAQALDIGYIVGQVALVILLLFIILFLLRSIYSFVYSIRQKHTLLEITPPAFTDKSSPATETLFTALHSLGMNKSLVDKLLGRTKSFSVEISSTKKTGIRFFIRSPKDTSILVEQLVASYLPHAKVKVVDDYLVTAPNRILEFKQCGHYAYPLKSYDDLSGQDPIGYITSAMTKLEKDEQISMQIVTQATHVRSADVLRYKILRNEHFMPAQGGGAGGWNGAFKLLLNAISASMFLLRRSRLPMKLMRIFCL